MEYEAIAQLLSESIVVVVLIMWLRAERTEKMWYMQRLWENDTDNDPTPPPEDVFPT